MSSKACFRSLRYLKIHSSQSKCRGCQWGRNLGFSTIASEFLHVLLTSTTCPTQKRGFARLWKACLLVLCYQSHCATSFVAAGVVLILYTSRDTPVHVRQAALVVCADI